MPVTPTYPGVYVQEVSSGVRTVAGVATSIAAFVGRAARGPVNEPTACFNFGEFTRRFGGLSANSSLSYAVDDFFANGGGQCEIVRVFKPAPGGDGVATVVVSDLPLRASSPGVWGDQLTAEIVDPVDSAPGTIAAAAKFGLAPGDLFDLIIRDLATGAVETFRNVTVRKEGGQRRVDRILEEGSSLVRCKFAGGDPVLPLAPSTVGPAPLAAGPVQFTGGGDGLALSADADYLGSSANKTGMYALEKADIFNLLCIPPDPRDGTLTNFIREQAAAFCRKRRALFIVDPPASWDANPATAASTVKTAQLNPVTAVMARTDVNRGVWKAPAGMSATISGIEGLTVKLTDEENGLLNPIAVNCLRSFPNIGRVVWGSRTLRGADQLSDDYKYIPVRRLALYIEESLYRGTQWVVFEPNDEPLWAQIRLSVGAFMQGLFRQGAFQGTAPRDAYFVKCDSSTTTQDDINQGIVNILVGFAPLQPAEFVIITIQQIRQAA